MIGTIGHIDAVKALCRHITQRQKPHFSRTDDQHLFIGIVLIGSFNMLNRCRAQGERGLGNFINGFNLLGKGDGFSESLG
ncbi:hypothetical protein SDC9_176830 [bioreactor metagenome]|uniref:Uncharacterized protein n=1 Tax=bioreactor metagenome TaxID=1076179 RepID=A0A645GR55_9ZZZZ